MFTLFLGDNEPRGDKNNGYESFRRIKRFNQGKMQEWHDRKRYNIAAKV